MTSLFYLALTDGTTTIELTDGTNYSISDESGWLPNVAFDSEQRTVVDSIPINILGALTVGGRSQGGRTRVNYIKLLTMLRQIERGQSGDGGVVTLVYTSPNSAPARRIACQVTRWDPSTFPADISSVINLSQSEINEVVLTLEHRVPWTFQSYLYANLLSNSLWSSSPGLSAVLGTAAFVPAIGYYGGAGLIRLTHTLPGTSSIYPSTLLAVTNGVPVTVTWTASWAPGIQSFRFVLIDSGSVTFRSSDVTQAVPVASAAMADGHRFTATVTPTITGNVRLFWQMLGNNGDVTEIAEVFVHATEAETWHRDTAIEGVSAVSSITHPIDTSLAISTSHALADTALTIAGFPSGTTYPTALGPIFVMAGAPAAVIIVYPWGTVPSGIWAGVADAARLAKGGFVIRGTPALANTYYAEPSGAAITMLDAMGPGARQTMTRRLQLVVVGVNNSASATFSLYVRGFTTQGSFIDSRPVDVPPNGADPQHIIMPELYHDLGFYDYRLFVASSIAGQTFDINRVIAYGVNEETNASISSSNYGLSQTGVVVFDPRTLTRPQPTLRAETAPGEHAYLRSFDLPLIRTRSTNVRLIVDAISDGLWQIAAAGAVTPLQAVLNRPPAFDAPL